jgi:hypothetical protein
MVGVADDGAVYASSLSVSENRLTIYRWNDDSTNAAPVVVYGPSDPAAGRWGDTMAVRGSGNNTQILLAARDGGHVCRVYHGEQWRHVHADDHHRGRRGPATHSRWA